MRIGTDWLPIEVLFVALHPVFGLDEDWNCNVLEGLMSIQTLHPVFGLDEDWNVTKTREAEVLVPDCIQSSGWMRIGTPVDR